MQTGNIMASEENIYYVRSGEDDMIAGRRVSHIFRELVKMWWIFLVVGVLAAAAGILYASNHPVKYKSRLTFALDDNGGNNGGLGSFLNLASQFGLNVGNGKNIFGGDNIIEIMKSRRMIEQVLLSVDTFQNKTYRLIDYFLDKSGKRKSNSALENIHFPVGAARESFSYKQDSILYNIYKEFADDYLAAERPDRKLSIYEINVTSPDEKFTKDFTDRIVAATNSFYIEIRTKKSKETLDILEQRVASMKGNLNSSLSNKAEIQDVNVNPAFSAAQVPVLKQQTNIQVYGTAYGEMFKNLELARFQYLNEIPLMQIIDDARYPMEKITVGKLKTGLLLAIFFNLLLFLVLWFRIIFKERRTK